MKAHLVSRVVILSAVFIAALMSSSCDSSSGFGMTPGVSSRWGSGTTGPAVIVGGPSR
jgi:hypothetical protein